MKILFIIDKYSHYAGASKALADIINGNSELDDPILLCKTHHSKGIQEPFVVIEGNAITAVDICISERYAVIHYFKADGCDLLIKTSKLLKKKGLNIPIITTVCQKPSFNPFLMGPEELKSSDYLVFIDKAASKDPLYKFIPDSQKYVVYCGSPAETIRKTESIISKYSHLVNEKIVIGRASQLIKFPMDSFDIYDQLSMPIEVRIIGGGSQISLIEKESKCHTTYKTSLLGNLPYDQYLDEMGKFDVFLYYLPQTGYSSIDFTLGEAMLLKKPCVYMGPDAPKERFIHGVNGFLANSKEELVKYCNLLINDKELRKRIGNEARKTTVKDFSFDATIHGYRHLYNIAINNPIPRCYDIPYKFKIFCKLNNIRLFVIKVTNKLLRTLNVTYQIDRN